MGMTWDDYAHDEYLEQTYLDQMYEDTVEEFTNDRLRSFYQQHPRIAESGESALTTAKALLASGFGSAALVFAAIAQEIGLKEALLRPVVYGLVHNEAAAGLITEFTVGRGSPTRFGRLILELLREHGGVDLQQSTRQGASKSIWAEIAAVVEQRNKVVHQAATITTAEAQTAVDVAEELFRSIFPTIVGNLGLHLHGIEVCGQDHAAPLRVGKSGRGPVETDHEGEMDKDTLNTLFP